MANFSDAMPHSAITEVLPDVFFVTGTMKGIFNESLWQFSRNMIVVREADALTLINSVRLDDQGLAELESLGEVTNIVRIGTLHSLDDAFYSDKYPNARYWALPGMPNESGLTPDVELICGGEMPLTGCTLFNFENTNLPEGILLLDREGGIAIACDALQNWVEPDNFFSDDSRALMTEMGFFQKANVGPVWMQVNEPKPGDFARLKQLQFSHALCGHGAPLINNAAEQYADTFSRLFNI